MKRFLVLLSLSLMFLAAENCAGEQDPRKEISLYSFNESPLQENRYAELPLGSIRAKGWLNEMLDRQKKGLTGQLDREYPLIMGTSNGWLGGDGDQWERGPYWIHGLITLAYTLDDPELIAKTKPWIEWILGSQKENGYFGPDTDYPDQPGVQRNNSADWWPRMVVLKILKQYYSATGDKRVIQLMTKYFRYQLVTLPEKPLDHWTFWAKYRGGDNLAMIYWLYNITADSSLLELADLVHNQTFDYTSAFLGDMIRKGENIHCVNLAQGIKEPAVYYQQHPDPTYLESVKKAFDDLRFYSGQPQGMFGGDEALRNNNPLNGIEFCSVVEMMYSLETILPITGDTRYADHLERIAFNALPSQATDDFMARQYFQQANQVMITRHEHNFSLNHGGTDICFGKFTGYFCCTSNMHQGWPLFTQNLWYATRDGGLAALVYAPSEVTALVGDGKKVTITEETSYPFRDSINLTVHHLLDNPVHFPLELRVPGWCDSASFYLNGEFFRTVPGPNITTINRDWHDGDRLTLILPAEVRLDRWHENSVSVERGPLVFALRIGEQWKKITNTKDPARYGEYFYEVRPLTPWNYGIEADPADPGSSMTVYHEDKMPDFPWNQQGTPLIIKAKGRRIPGWNLYNETAGPLPYSVRAGHETGQEEIITLVPYGCTALRISEFPLLGLYGVME